MVGRLYYFAKDPNGDGRGAGNYYHRGHQKWSKYDRGRDLNRSAGTTISKRMAGNKLRGKLGHYPHIFSSFF